MSQYIDIDAVVDAPLWDYKCSIDDQYGCGYFDALDEAMKLLDDQPAIEIIRCKDCRWFKRRLYLAGEEPPSDGICIGINGKAQCALISVNENHFCGFAKRKEG